MLSKINPALHIWQHKLQVVCSPCWVVVKNSTLHLSVYEELICNSTVIVEKVHSKQLERRLKLKIHRAQMFMCIMTTK